MTLEELGAALRHEREKRALSIDDVSEILKIHVRLLRALEEGDTASLPHPTYIRGFVRSYASFLGLAAEEINSTVIPGGHFGSPVTSANIYISEPPKSPRKKNHIFTIILFLAVAGGVALVWRPLHTTLTSTPQRLAEPSPPAASSQQQPQPSSPAKVSSPGASTQKNTRPEAQARRGGAGEPEQQPQSAQVPAPAESQVSVPVSPPANAVDSDQAPVADSAQTRPLTHSVIVTATEECWIYSRADGTDTRQFSLQKGDAFALTFQKKLEMKLGNAGGVRIRYDGQDMPVLGQSGQVRTLSFPPQDQ